MSRPAVGPAQPPIQWMPRTSSPGVKRTESDAGQSPPLSTQVKNPWSYISITPYIFTKWYSIWDISESALSSDSDAVLPFKDGISSK
jgi:hypothetical protein